MLNQNIEFKSDMKIELMILNDYHEIYVDEIFLEIEEHGFTQVFFDGYKIIAETKVDIRYLTFKLI